MRFQTKQRKVLHRRNLALKYPWRMILNLCQNSFHSEIYASFFTAVQGFSISCHVGLTNPIFLCVSVSHCWEDNDTKSVKKFTGVYC